MHHLRVGRALAAALLLALGCGDTIIAGTPTPPRNCVARCQAIVASCERTQDNCNATCDSVNEAQLSCVEKAGCDEVQTTICVNIPDTDTPDENQVPDPGNICQVRCAAVAQQCSDFTFHCPQLCEHIGASQLSCVEQSSCDATTVSLCLDGGPGSGGSGGSAGTAGAAGTGSGGVAGSSGGSGQSGAGQPGGAGQAGQSGGAGQPGSTCPLLHCTSTMDVLYECNNWPCMSNVSGKGYCYEPATTGQCGSGEKAVPATVNKQSATLCVPAGCPDPWTYEP